MSITITTQNELITITELTLLQEETNTITITITETTQDTLEVSDG